MAKSYVTEAVGMKTEPAWASNPGVVSPMRLATDDCVWEGVLRAYFPRDMKQPLQVAWRGRDKKWSWAKVDRRRVKEVA